MTQHEDANAQSTLGDSYYTGTCVPQSYALAAQAYEKAATQGYKTAQYNLEWMYLEGKGVLQNKSNAAKWFQLAADQGHNSAKDALNNLKNSKPTQSIFEKLYSLLNDL